jgi:hypothetical protein
MLVLLLAVLAWPAIARFFTFASVQVGGGAGLAALLGFAGGRLSTAGGPPIGPSPDTFGQESASRTMSSFASRGGGAAAAGAGTAAGPMGMAAAASVRFAQQAVNSLAGGMEKMAGHAGVQGANPYAAQPAGYVNRHVGAPLPTTGGLFPDQPEPDWSGRQEPSAEPAEAFGRQADHQTALQGATPDLPLATTPRGDPPTVEMPAVPSPPADTTPAAPSPASRPDVAPAEPPTVPPAPTTNLDQPEGGDQS